MRAGLFVALVVCLVLASGAWAQGFGSGRLMGMSAAIAVVDDATAWNVNPAALARLNVCPAREGKEWANDLLLGYGENDYGSSLGFSWSGWNQEANLGFGAGYVDHRSYSKGFGMGVGRPFGEKWAAGINFGYLNTPTDGAVTFNGGVLYDFSQAVRGGLVVSDLFGRYDVGPFFDAGLAAYLSPRLLVAVDVYDITDEVDVSINGGAEYALSDRWDLRAGTFDSGDGHDLSVGLGWAGKAWRVDAAYRDSEDSEFAVTVGHNF